MSKIVFLLFFLPSIVPCMHAMEIEYRIVESKPACKAHRSLSQGPFFYNILQLSPKITQQIFKKLSETDEPRHSLAIAKCLYKVRNRIPKIQPHCPLVVGNKVFDVQGLIKLSKKQRTDLIDMGNPSCVLGLCGINNKVVMPHNLDTLRGMPKSIKRNMNIGRCSYDRIVNDQRVSYCSDGTLCTGISGLGGTSFLWIATGCNMSNGVLGGLFGGWLGCLLCPSVVCVTYSGVELCCCRDIHEVKL
jgi:hypothetical protein